MIYILYILSSISAKPFIFFRLQQKESIFLCNTPDTTSHSQIDFLYLLDVRLLLTKAQKEIEAIPIPANGLRGILPNLNLNQIFSDSGADFHVISSFGMSQSKGNVYHSAIDVFRNREKISSENALFY